MMILKRFQGDGAQGMKWMGEQDSGCTRLASTVLRALAGPWCDSQKTLVYFIFLDSQRA